MAAKQEEPAADSLPATGGDPLDYDTVSWSACHVNCGSRCPLKAYVKDGQVVRIDIDSDGDDEFGPGKIYQMRSCVRGRTNRQRIYSPDRIQKPLKRVEGTKRGEGKYEEITWDEAINLIATTMKEIKAVSYTHLDVYKRQGKPLLCPWPRETNSASPPPPPSSS